MNRLTLRERNDDGTGISTLPLIEKDEEGRIHTTEHTGYIVTTLADYEDLHENGRLIKIPCRVGDSVWTFNMEQGYVYKYIVINEFHAILVKDLWNKKFFETREEAEAVLKEISEERYNLLKVEEGED